MAFESPFSLISNEIVSGTVGFSFLIGFAILYTAYSYKKWKTLRETDKTFFSLVTGWIIYLMLAVTIFTIASVLTTLFQTTLPIKDIVYLSGLAIFFLLIIINLSHTNKTKMLDYLHTICSLFLLLLVIISIVFFSIYFGVLISSISGIINNRILVQLFFLFISLYLWAFLIKTGFEKIGYKNKSKIWKMLFKFNKRRVLTTLLSLVIIAIISNLVLFPKTNLIEHKENEYELNRYISSVSRSDFDFIAKTQEDFQIKKTGRLGWLSLYYGDYFNATEQLATLTFKEGHTPLASINFGKETTPYSYYNNYVSLGIKSYFIDNKSKNIVLKFDKDEFQKHNITKIELWGNRKIKITSSNFSIRRKYLDCDSNSVCKVQLNITNNLMKPVRIDNEQIFSFDEFRSDLLKCIISNISVITFHNEEKKDNELVLCKSDTKICEVENSFYFSANIKNLNSRFILDSSQINENTSVKMDIYAKC